MSSSQPPGGKVRTVSVRDPRTNWDGPTYFAAIDGPDSINHINFPANTSSTNSGVSVSANFDQSIGIQRDLYMKYYLQVTLTGEDQGVPLLRLGLDDAPRFMPVHSSATSITMSINGSTFTQQMSEYLDAIYRYTIDDDVLTGRGSMFPCMQDTYADYSDYTTEGTFQNPLGSYGESLNPRGGFPIQIVSNTNTEAVVRFVSSEPLISPAMLGEGKFLTSIANVNNIVVQVNLAGGMLNRVWSHATSGNPLTVSNVSFYQTPELRVTVLQGNAATFKPDMIKYPFYQIIPQAGPSPITLAPGSRSQFTVGNMVLSGIPNSILIYVAKPFSSKTITDPDTYAFIDQLNVRFSTQTLWNGANAQDIYSVSQQNGLKTSWPSYSGHAGSVIRLTANDLNLNYAQAGGTSGSYSLTIDAWATNLRNAEETFQIFCVQIYDGIVDVTPSATVQSINPITQEQYVMATQAGPSDLSYRDYRSAQQLAGAGFWGDVWSGVKNVGKAIAGPVADVGIGLAKKFVGLGGRAVGGGKKGGYSVGGADCDECYTSGRGGAETSASALRRLIKER